MTCCDFCGSFAATKRCSRCHTVFYCGRDCQLKAWKALHGHKTVCKKKQPSPKNKEQFIYQLEKGSCAPPNQVGLMHSLCEMALQSGLDDGNSEKRWMQGLIQHYNRTPALHKEFSKSRDNLKCLDIVRCTELLSNIYNLKRGLFQFEFALCSADNLMRHTESIHCYKRLGNTSRTWFENASFGDVYSRSATEFSSYDVKHMLHSYSNALTRQDVLSCGTVHVAVAYVDLSTLLWCELDRQKSAPLRWIGYEASAYAVAKTLIINEMFNASSVDSILQVWYSSAWSTTTLREFRDALQRVDIGAHGPDVARFLVTWRVSEVPTLRASRAGWLDKTDESLFGPAVNAVGVNDRLSLINYFLTGQLLPATVGSLTMFAIPEPYTNCIARNESAFQGIQPTELYRQRNHSKSFVSAAIEILRTRVGRLRKWIKEGKVSIQVQAPAVVSLEAVELLSEISALSPHTMSWSNLCDYISFNDFHSLARRCSASSDTVHFGYTMNWPQVTVGTYSIDYASGKICKKILDVARAQLRLSYREFGANQYLILPEIVNPMNVADICLRLSYYEKWLAVFFEFDDPNPINVASCDPTAFLNVFARANSEIFMTWTYDKFINFLLRPLGS